MDTLMLEARAGRAADTEDPDRSIAELASRMEAQPGYWRGEFETLQRRAVRWPRLGGPPQRTLATDHALALQSAEPEGEPPLELRLARLLVEGKRVAVDLTGAAAGGQEAEGSDLPSWYQGLERRLEGLGIAERIAAWSMRADDPGLRAFLDFAAAAGGQCLVRLPEAFMRALRDGTALEGAGGIPLDVARLWPKLLERAAAGALELVLEHHLNATSPLAPSEPTEVVIPGILQASRSAAALLWFDFDLAAFAAGGALDRRGLTQALEQAVRFGDDLLDQLHWPLESIRRDAVAQRRLAINLIGLGETVEALRLDPRRFETLQALVELVRELRRAACRASRSLALERSPFPSLRAEQLLSLVPAPELAGEVRARLDGQATRNRSLLSLSPWSVLPARAESESRLWANLLPVLCFADSLSFRRPPGTPRLGAAETDFFLRLAWAYTRRRTPAPAARSLTGGYALSSGEW